MEGAPELVLAVMVVVIALSGYSALYFATRCERRTPAVVALVAALENLKHREPAAPSEYHPDVQARARPASSLPTPP